MRPTPTKSRPTSRSPVRSSPRRATTKGKGNNLSSARRSLEDSLGSSTFAAKPVTKMKKSKRGRSPGVTKVAADVASNKNNDTPAKNRSNSGSKPKKAYGRRGRMSPRTHGAAIAKSLASPAVDSEFLMSSTAPITPSKRSTAESALHYLARNTKRGRNDGTTQSDDNNNSTLSRKQRMKRQVVNAGSEQQTEIEFIPKGKVEERWLKNFNKWKQSIENQGHDGIANNQSPIPKSWINAQRKEYKAMKENKKTSMTQAKADLLESAGFTWDAPIRRPKKNSSSSNNVDDAAADVVDEMSVSKRSSPRRSCPTQFYHNLSEKVDEKGNEKRSNSNTGEEKRVKKGEESRSSPRRSRPTQFYHNLLGKEDERGNEKRSNSNTGEKKKDKKELEQKTKKSVSNIKGGYTCSKCGQPKKGHTCTKGESNEDEEEDEKAIETLELLASSSDEIEKPSTQKRQGKKRRSRGGQHKGSTLSSLETLQASAVSSKKRKVKQADGAEMKKAIAPSKTKNVSSDATKQNRKPGNTMEGKPPTEVSENEAPVSEDQPISPFPSSPLQASNLECPESGSLSVGQAQNSPATKKIPESICIRELMMSCLTEEDKEEGKRNSKSRPSELKSSASTEGADDEDEVTKKADEPLPNTPIQNKETPLSSFSPLSMTSPLRANNLLETSYNEEPEDKEISQPNENCGDSLPDQPAAKHRSTGTSRRSNQMIQVQPRNISTAISAEMATQTSERVDEAKQLQLIQAEKQYQAKMAEFGKLELEAKMVTERMRQIEERMRQFESSSISNDLRVYDEMKRRTSYPAETLRPSKRKMITSQRYYGSSDDDFSDEYDPHRNWRHSTHGRHGDRERSIKRRKIQPDSRRSRSKSQRSSQSKSKRSNTQRRRIEDSMVEDDRDRSSVSRKHRKKGSRKKAHEAVQHSASQVDEIALKSPYAVLRSDEGKSRETRQPDESFDVEKDAATAEMEENDTATSTESEKMPGKAREQNKKDSDSSSTKQSSIERAENRNDASHTHKQNEDNTKAPLYWLAGGESDSDEESWDFDGPMILPPPPA